MIQKTFPHNFATHIKSIDAGQYTLKVNHSIEKKVMYSKNKIGIDDVTKKKMHSMDAMGAQRMNNDDVHSMDILGNQRRRYSRNEILKNLHRNHRGINNTLQNTRYAKLGVAILTSLKRTSPTASRRR